MIGLWFARLSAKANRLTLWHLCESEIADRKVTKCGRQMGEIEGTSLAPVVTPPTAAEACLRCKSVSA